MIEIFCVVVNLTVVYALNISCMSVPNVSAQRQIQQIVSQFLY